MWRWWWSVGVGVGGCGEEEEEVECGGGLEKEEEEGRRRRRRGRRRGGLCGCCCCAVGWESQLDGDDRAEVRLGRREMEGDDGEMVEMDCKKLTVSTGMMGRCRRALCFAV